MSQKDKLGFKETLSPKQEISVKLTTQNDKLCPEISTIGQKLNNSFFISNAGSLSQFPYLTSLGNTRRVKSLEGGGGKSQKYINIKNKSNKNKSNKNRNNKKKGNKNKSNKNKRKSCKHIHH
jgi:hypothetical protein